jgi:uncharacterized membrane protein YphA (DoxX/SURF4 family)
MPSQAIQSKVTALLDWADVLGRVALAMRFLWSAYTKFAYMASNIAYMTAYGTPVAEMGPGATRSIGRDRNETG